MKKQINDKYGQKIMWNAGLLYVFVVTSVFAANDVAIMHTGNTY